MQIAIILKSKVVRTVFGCVFMSVVVGVLFTEYHNLTQKKSR